MCVCVSLCCSKTAVLLLWCKCVQAQVKPVLSCLLLSQVPLSGCLHFMAACLTQSVPGCLRSLQSRTGFAVGARCGSGPSTECKATICHSTPHVLQYTQARCSVGSRSVHLPQGPLLSCVIQDSWLLWPGFSPWCSVGKGAGNADVWPGTHLGEALNPFANTGRGAD